MFTILGIDQSYTSSGFCVLNQDGGVVELGTIKTSEEANGDIFNRAALVADSTISLAVKHKPLKVGMEGLAFSKFGNATRDLAGLQFVLITRFRATEFGEKITIISPNLLKKFATGKGNAGKPDMASALPPHVLDMITKMNFKKTTGLYDIADAYWIAQYTLEQYKKLQK